MIDVQSCRQHAADCLRQAQEEDSADDRTILLNVALAWLRLGHQTQEWSEQESSGQHSSAQHSGQKPSSHEQFPSPDEIATVEREPLVS